MFYKFYFPCCTVILCDMDIGLWHPSHFAPVCSVGRRELETIHYFMMNFMLEIILMIWHFYTFDYWSLWILGRWRGRPVDGNTPEAFCTSVTTMFCAVSPRFRCSVGGTQPAVTEHSGARAVLCSKRNSVRMAERLLKGWTSHASLPHSNRH